MPSAIPHPVEETLCFSPAVTLGTAGEDLAKRARGVGAPAQAQQADRAIVACLGREDAVWKVAEIVLPGSQ